MKVSAVVVTYNRRELLEKTLAGLEAQERPLDHIVIIDNAEQKASALNALMQKLQPI